MLVGILFLILGGLDINDPDHQKTADILNNTATVMMMMTMTMTMMIMQRQKNLVGGLALPTGKFLRVTIKSTL